jgi:aspartyl/asparaginyl beta-hydroxylase (cupin superfamily)
MKHIFKPYGIPSSIKEEIISNWEKIKDDYLSLEDSDSIDYEEDNKFYSEKNKWKVFKLRNYPFGEKLNEHKCEYTHKLLDKIPRLKGAAFSTLKPNSKIKAHKGLKDSTIRHHLGLIVPSDTWIKIGGENHFWEEGKIFSFDDSILHEVFNLSDKKRVILIFDVQNRFSLKWFLLKLLIKLKIIKIT